MTRQQRRRRNHQRTQDQRRRAGVWGTAGQWGMRCAHCGHSHIMFTRCRNCHCTDFDF